MNHFFVELFEYNHHCNARLAEAFMTNADTNTEKAVKLFSHLLNAQHIWNHRIALLAPAYTVWQAHPVQDLPSLEQSCYEHSVAILQTCDLSQIRSYVNSQGQAYDNTIQEMLFHTVNHSTYHRGQIASQFKLHGVMPLVTDYIAYKR